jgi:transposase
MSESAPVPTDRPRRPGARAATRQAWVERLERFAHSGLRPSEFCAREGVSLPAFYSWKRRLAASGAGGTNPTPDPETGPRWLPVRLAADPALELVLPRGAVLRVPPGSDLSLVRALVAALGGAPC